MKSPTEGSPPRLTLETGGALLPETKQTNDDPDQGTGVEEQRAVPEGYRRFTVCDHEGVLIQDTLIRTSSIHPGFISGLHAFLASEDPGPRLV